MAANVGGFTESPNTGQTTDSTHGFALEACPDGVDPELFLLARRLASNQLREDVSWHLEIRMTRGGGGNGTSPYANGAVTRNSISSVRELPS